MSIPGIPGITAVTRAASTAAGTATATASPAVQQTGQVPNPGTEAGTLQPTPPRFPWLSRLSQQLEQATGQKPAFAAAPVLGDNVDRSV